MFDGWTSGDKRQVGQPGQTQTITKSDSTTYDPPLYALRVGTTAGDIAVVYRDGTTDTIPNVQVGETIPCGPIKKVMSTSTTAVGITGFYYPNSGPASTG